MTSYIDLHDQAMDCYDHYEVARKRGDRLLSQRKLQESLSLEKEAASLVPSGVEPTGSVLYRSAASIALEMGLHGETYTLVVQGLSRAIHQEIKNELLELMTKETRFMSLALAGEVLDPNKTLKSSVEDWRKVEQPMPLNEWLGMTREEYQFWKNHPRQLRIVLQARHLNIPVTDLASKQSDNLHRLAARGQSDDKDIKELMRWLKKEGHL